MIKEIIDGENPIACLHKRFAEMDPKKFHDHVAGPITKDVHVLGEMTDEMKKLRMLWLELQDDREERDAAWIVEIAESPDDRELRESQHEEWQLFDFLIDIVHRETAFATMCAFGIVEARMGWCTREGLFVIPHWLAYHSGKLKKH